LNWTDKSGGRSIRVNGFKHVKRAQSLANHIAEGFAI